ncbi:hypothetical protein GEMRC1_013388 [Eukaryota sp. GEM-RC1]
MMPASCCDVDIVVPMKNSDGMLGFLKIQVKDTQEMFKNCVSFQVSGIPSVSIGLWKDCPTMSPLKSSSDAAHNRTVLGLDDVSSFDYESVFYMNLEDFKELRLFMDKLCINNNWYESIHSYQ